MGEPKSNLWENAREACRIYDGQPVAIFVQGKVGSGLQRRETTIMLLGPRLNLDNLAKLRSEMLEAMDVKEKQLRGDKLPPRRCSCRILKGNYGTKHTPPRGLRAICRLRNHSRKGKGIAEENIRVYVDTRPKPCYDPLAAHVTGNG
jgi:hypothetical protein